MDLIEFLAGHEIWVLFVAAGLIWLIVGLLVAAVMGRAFRISDRKHKRER